MNIDQRLEHITNALEHHEKTLDAFMSCFRQIGDNFRTIEASLTQTNENFQQHQKAIAELRAISEVHHYRIRKLEGGEPDITEPKQRGAA